MRNRRPVPSLRAATHVARASALTIAVRMLARREYARAELERRLLSRGVDATEVERALERLARDGYLSDERYAHGVVAQKSGRFAKRAIAHELREKGVDRATASAALETLDGRDEVAEATALWTRRYGAPPTDEREKSRQLRFLLSRGYSMAVAFKVLKAVGVAHEPQTDP